jgi:hypothetical protein
MTGAALGMSREAIDWVYSEAPDVPAPCVSLLAAMAHHADRLGRGSRLSVPTLVRYTRKSKRQVQYDLETLTDLKLIRPGDQSLVAHLPHNRRPVVYDLAMEQMADGVQPAAPQDVQLIAPQSRNGVQPIAPQDDVQPVAPHTITDLGERPGVQPTAPQGSEDADVLGCNTASAGVQPTAPKLKEELTTTEGANAPSAQTILANFIDWVRDEHGGNLTRRTIGILAKQLGELVEQHVDDRHIRKGLANWFLDSKGQHPATLDSFVNAAINAAARNRAPQNGQRRDPGANARGWADAGRDLQERLEGGAPGGDIA